MSVPPGPGFGDSSGSGDLEELRERFRAQEREGFVEARQREARRARGLYTAVSGLVAVVCLVLIVVRIGRGEGAGIWVATYAVGVVLSGWGLVLARSGHTRWAMGVTCVGAALASVGDSAAFR